MDWLNWEDRLRQLAGDVAESTWPDPQLQEIEADVVRTASVSAATWMARIMTYLPHSLDGDAREIYRKIRHVSDPDPVDVPAIDARIVMAISTADRRMAHIDTLPRRGPDMEELPSGIFRPPVRVPRGQAEFLARQSAGTKMRAWAEGMREDVRWQVVQAIREGIPASVLKTRLQARWTDYGQHFSTIAATELAIAYNDAILRHYEGQHVVIPRIGDSRVCKACAKWLEGRVFYVSPVAIEHPTKQQQEQYLWVGKNNIGRAQKDWRPCLPMHPNCRHVAVKYRGGNPHDYLARSKTPWGVST